jgi:hypothetical protein
MKVTVTHTLNARFVEIASPSLEEFRDGEVFVRIETSVPDGRSFATVVCAGTADHPGPSNEAESLLAPHLLVDATEQPLAEQKEIRSAWFMIERVLQRVGKTLRWRFGIFGDDSVFSSTRLDVDLGDGAVLELTPMASAVMGDDIARIGPDGLREVAELVGASVEQPLAHELWRESWNLRYASPRSSLVVGVAAAEVGIKQLIAVLVPGAEALVEHLPSPPLPTLIHRVLPSLPVKSGVESNRRCPRDIAKQIARAIEVRNLVIHRGAPVDIDLRSTLLDIRDFLYLLDHHGGHRWAVELLADRTRAAIDQN